jgi:hypothetical protein
MGPTTKGRIEISNGSGHGRIKLGLRSSDALIFAERDRIRPPVVRHPSKAFL